MQGVDRREPGLDGRDRGLDQVGRRLRPGRARGPAPDDLGHLAEVQGKGLAGALAVGGVPEQSLLELAAADASHAVTAAGAVHEEAVEGPEAGPRIGVWPCRGRGEQGSDPTGGVRLERVGDSERSRNAE